MKKDRYSREEVIVLSYLARYGNSSTNMESIIFNTVQVIRSSKGFEPRPVNHIRMKLRNITSLLKNHGVEYNRKFTPLSGVKLGCPARLTDWNVVNACLGLEQAEHKALVRHFCSTF